MRGDVWYNKKAERHEQRQHAHAFFVLVLLAFQREGMNYRATTLFLVGVILVMLALGPIIVAYSWLRYRIATMSDTTSRDIAGLRDDVWKSLTLGDETRRALVDHKRTFDHYRDAEAERHAEERGKRWFVPGLWAILSVVISSVLVVLVLNILGV